MTWGIDERAATLHREALVWDNHAGFAYGPKVDLSDLNHWRDAGVNYISVNVGFDVAPWDSLTIQALSSYRRQIREHGDRFVLAGDVSDVLRAQREGKLAVAFDIEGMNALNGDAGMVEVFYQLGVRQMLFAYNRNNLAGGGCHDDDTGLSAFGRDVIREMNRVGMVVDCSHTGFRTTMEAMEASSAPVIFSHSNVRSLCDHERNIRDEQIKACASIGGVIGVTGVGLFIGPNGGKVDDLVRHIDYICELVGAQHVGIGMDTVLRVDELEMNPHSYRSYWPASQYPEMWPNFMLPDSLPLLTERLLDRGYREEDVHNIVGKNFLRLAERVWN